MFGKIEKIPKEKYRNFDFLLNLLISVIKREFYSNPSRPAPEALEASLNKANLYLADFTEKGNIEWFGNLHFVCGVFSQNKLYITQTGEPIIKLFRATTITHIENKFPPRKKVHPLKTFGNIVSGTLMNGDKIILGTKDIINIAPLNILKELFKKGEHQVINRLKQIVESKVSVPPIICLIIEVRSGASQELTEHFPSLAAIPPLKPKRSGKIIIISQKALKNVFIGLYKITSFLIFLLKKLFGFSKIIFPRRVESFLSKLFYLLRKKIKSAVKNKHINLKIRILYQKNKTAFFVACALMILLLILPFMAIYKINYYANLDNFNKLSAEIGEIQNKGVAALRGRLLASLAEATGVANGRLRHSPDDWRHARLMTLAGLTSVADWIASSEKHFPPAGEAVVLSCYWPEELLKAWHALDDLGWTGWHGRPRSGTSQAFSGTSLNSDPCRSRPRG